MLFFRQTLLSVCLILSCAFALAQPEAVDDDLGQIDEDSGPTPYFNILVNDDAGAGFTLNSATVDLNTSTPGTYDASVTTVGGVFTYDLVNSVMFAPDPDFEGAVSVDYTVATDEPQTLTATISIMVNAVNDAPTITAPMDQDIDEDVPTLPLPVTITDIDDDLNSLNVTGTSGDIAVVADAGISFGGAGGSRTVIITPVLDANGGPVTITLQVEDGAGSTVQDVFDVTVAAVNDAPTFTTLPGAQTVDEDETTAPLAVVIADVDDDPNTLSLTATSGNVAIIEDAGITLGGSGGARTATVAPLSNASGGPVTISLEVEDAAGLTAQGAFDVTVSAVNDAPTFTAAPGAQIINEDEPTNALSVTVADIDDDPNDLTVTGSSGDPAIISDAGISVTGTGPTRTVTVAPLADQNGGPVSITLNVADDDALSAQTSFDVTVTAVNDAPTMTLPGPQTTPENTPTAALPITVADIDSPLGSLTLTGSSSDVLIIPDANIAFGGANANRTVIITPAADENGGPVNIGVTVTDDALATATASFPLTVTAVDDIPTITGPGPQVINEGSSTGALNFTVGDSDTPLADLVVTATSSDQTIIPDANVVIAGGLGATRTVTVTPPTNQNGGPVTITLEVSDGVETATATFTVTITAVNDGPTITGPAAQTFNEGGTTGALNFTVADIDDVLADLIVTGTSNDGTIIPNANIVIGGGLGATRTVTVTPPVNQNGGPVTITLEVSDGDATATATFTVTINAVNDAPTITGPGAQNINENTSTGALNFTVGDIDDALADLTVAGSSSDVGIIPNANIVIAGGLGATRTVTVTPAANQSGGPVTITLQVNDGDVTTSTTFTVTVGSVNDIPTITGPGPQVINEGSSTGALNFTVGDADNPLTDLTVTGTSNNQTIIPDANIVIAGGLGATRTVTVTPPTNQNGGPVTITLEVSDGAETATATFTVTITPVNDGPTITAPAAQTFNEGGTTGALNFTVADIDDALADLTVTGTSSNVTIIPNANIVIAGGLGATRTVTVTPPVNQNGGPVTITLEVSDGDATATAVFTVTINAVNDAPTITGPGPQNINENTSTGPLNFTVGDIDNILTDLSVTSSSSDVTIIPNANVVIGGGLGATRTVTVTPAANQSGGPVTITLQVNDGNASSITTFTVTVGSVNDPPTITGPGPQVINEGSSTGALNFTVGDADNPLTDLTVTGTSNNQTIIPDANIVIGGGLGATRTVTVTPPTNQSGGPVTITLEVTDGSGSSTATFAVTVTPVNDVPTITGPAAQTFNEGGTTGALNFTVADIDDALADLTVTGTSSDVTIIPNANIVIGGGLGATRTVTVTPPVNQSGGPVTITLEVSDGDATATATFTVTINGVNDAPTIAAPGPQTTSENTPTAALNFTVADIDNPLTDLTVTGTSSNVTLIPNANILIAGGTGATRTVTVTPAANQSGGPVTITLQVSDGSLTGTSTFTVTIDAINDPPTITGPGSQTINEDTNTGALNFTVGDIDTPIGSLTVTAASSDEAIIPAGNIVIGGGTGATRTVTVTPLPNQSGGPVNITLTVSDGSASAAASFGVTVTAIDDAPSITTIASQSTNEDAPTGLIPFTVGDAETAVTDLTVVATSDNTSLVPDVNIVIAGAGASKTVQITPAANQSGIAIITLTVGDGTNTTPTTFQLTVNTANDPPTITAIGDQTINEDTPSAAIPFTVGDVETAAATLTTTASSGNAALIPNANIVLGGSGPSRTVQVTPLANQFGTAVITVNVNDGVNTTSTTFQVTVNSMNDAATITPIANQTVNEDNATAALAFTLADTETAPAALTVTGVSDNTALVPNANIVFSGTGANRSVIVTPAANQNGVANITLTVNDGTNDTPTAFQLTVTAVNDAPVITAQTPVSTVEEQAVDILITHVTVTDPDNTFPDDFTLTVLANPGYTFTANTITPNANVTGNVVVRVQVSDNVASSNIYNLQVTVTSVNDPPTITAQNPSPLVLNEDGSFAVLISHLTIVDPDNTSGFTLSLADGANYSVSGNVITPDPNYSGALSVPVTVNDGTSPSAPYALQLQVNPVNDVPQITGQVSITIAEVQPVAIDLSQLTVFDPDDTYPDDFSIAILSGPNYSITSNTVVPVPNFSGTLLVRVFVNDGVANSAIYNLQISVNTTNDPPVITGQVALNTDEGEPITIVLGNLTVVDPDTDPADFTLAILPGANYTFAQNIVTPNAGVEGVISVGVKVNDGQVDSAPFNLQITINGINNAPEITGQQPVTTTEEQDITLRLADLIVSDPDSPFPGSFTLSVSGGANYTISGHTISPAKDFSGTLSVPVTVNDGQLTSESFNVNVVVTAVNDAPLITGQNSLTTFEDQPIVLKLADLLVTDVDNPYPTGFSLAVQPGSGATYTVNGATVTPVLNFNGTLTVSVTVNDGAAGSPANSNVFPVEIGVTSVNDAPTLNAINNVTIQEDPLDPTTISLAGITSGAGEASQTVTVTAAHNKPDWFEKFEVVYSGGGTGTLTVKPLPNKFGTATITVRVQDSGAGTAPNVNFTERSFSFIVQPVNDPPLIITAPLTIVEAGLEYSYLIEAEDVEQEVITFGAPLLPDWLTLSQNANGRATLSGTPPPGTTGEISVILQVKDPTGTPVTNQEFTITVNTRPVISAFNVSTDEEIMFSFGPEFAGNFVDADADTLTEVEITMLPTKGTLLLGQTAVTLNQKIQSTDIKKGRLTYMPMTDSTGTDTLSWNASDGIFFSTDAKNIIITIRPVNDPPVIIALEAPESDTLKYELGSERPIQLTKIFDAVDVDGDDILAAEISFTDPQQYYTSEDKFLFKDTLGITGTFNETLGILSLSGRSTVANYIAAIRSIKYNLIVAPIESRAKVGDNRRISIKLSDGVFGGTKERLVGLISTFQELDIASAFTPTGANPVWNIYSPNGLEQYKDALIKVYNKRGTLVYEARGFSVPWNGDGPEGALPADSYFYTIDLKYDKKKYKGVVTILR